MRTSRRMNLAAGYERDYAICPKAQHLYTTACTSKNVHTWHMQAIRTPNPKPHNVSPKPKASWPTIRIKDSTFLMDTRFLTVPCVLKYMFRIHDCLCTDNIDSTRTLRLLKKLKPRPPIDLKF